MIKSFLLNNLLVPLRQISAPMLLASAALHSLLLVVPIPSNSTNADASKDSNPGDADAIGTEELLNKEKLCDEDGSLINKAGEDTLSEDSSLSDDTGEDTLSENSSLSDDTGEDTLSEDSSLSDDTGEDTLSEDSSLSDDTGEDTLSEDSSLSDDTGEDTLSEDSSIPDEIEEEIGDKDSATPKSLQELCEEENSLPKGKSVKVPGEIPLLKDLEEESDKEEIADGDNKTPDLDLDEEDDSIDDISSNQEEIEDESDLLSESDNLTVSEPESETEIAFTPSETIDETTDDTISETVDEIIDDTIPETVDETTDDTIPETVDETTDDAIPETVDETTDDAIPETVDETTDDAIPETVDETTDDTIPEPEKIAEPESTDTTTESNPEETNNQPQPRLLDPFAEFPKYTGVKPYVCGTQIARIDRRTRRTSDSLSDVQAYFEEKLADTDFQVEKLADKPDTKVYQISKGNLTQYLQLFAFKEQGTMILLSSRRVDCYRLSNENQPAESTTSEQAFDATFRQLYTQLGWTEEIEKVDFAANSQVETIFGKDTNNTPEELASLVKSKLESEGFEASQVTDETSGLLYEVKKGDFTKYISFVATQSGEGAIVIALKNEPS